MEDALPNAQHLSGDGYVRAPLAAILAMHFKHFLSGLDDDPTQSHLEGACPTSLSGYTEWLTESGPVISLGWDWRLDLATGSPVYVRDGLPRSNLMAQDSLSGKDLGGPRTMALLATLIDRWNWQNAVVDSTGARYA